MTTQTFHFMLTRRPPKVGSTAAATCEKTFPRIQRIISRLFLARGLRKSSESEVILVATIHVVYDAIESKTQKWFWFSSRRRRRRKWLTGSRGKGVKSSASSRRVNVEMLMRGNSDRRSLVQLLKAASAMRWEKQTQEKLNEMKNARSVLRSIKQT